MNPENNPNDHHDNRDEQGDARRKHRRKKNDDKDNLDNLDRTERVIKVCELFLQGMKNREIVAWMQQKYGIRITHRTLSNCLQEAAARGWLHLRAPDYFQVSGQLKQRYPWPEEIEVVHSPGISHIARRAAEILCKLIKRRAGNRQGRRVVHIGWPGGYQSREIAYEFVQLLCRSPQGLPDEIVIHCMGSGVKIGDPRTDPQFIFLGLMNQPFGLPVDLRIIGFPGPGLVDTSHFDIEALKQWAHMQEVMAEAEKLDFIVTAAGSWSDEHSVFSQTMKSSPEVAARLAAEDVIGDILWRPVGRRGPIEVETGLRYMTLVELKYLTEFIARGRKVLLMVGPCEICCQPKGELLRVLLELEGHLFTHLVCDSATARDVLEAA